VTGSGPVTWKACAAVAESAANPTARHIILNENNDMDAPVDYVRFITIS
jgi:hypothetical protein